MTPERWRQVDDLFIEVSELLLAHDAPTAKSLDSAVKSGLEIWANKTGNFVDKHVGPYKAHQDLPKDLWFLRDLASAEELLGELAVRRGDRQEARSQYERALALWNKWNTIG